MKHKVVRIDVLDISVDSGWWEYNPKSHKATMKTIPIYGILVERNKDWVVLAQGYNKPAGDWLNEVSIPRAIVKRIRVLEEV